LTAHRAVHVQCPNHARIEAEQAGDLAQLGGELLGSANGVAERDGASDALFLPGPQQCHLGDDGVARLAAVLAGFLVEGLQDAADIAVLNHGHDCAVVVEVAVRDGPWECIFVRDWAEERRIVHAERASFGCPAGIEARCCGHEDAPGGGQPVGICDEVTQVLRWVPG
jgi:hypothetical protein